jgi:hypothetical protein
MSLAIPIKRTPIYSKEIGLNIYKEQIKTMPLLANEVIS